MEYTVAQTIPPNTVDALTGSIIDPNSDPNDYVIVNNEYYYLPTLYTELSNNQSFVDPLTGVLWGSLLVGSLLGYYNNRYPRYGYPGYGIGYSPYRYANNIYRSPYRYTNNIRRSPYRYTNNIRRSPYRYPSNIYRSPQRSVAVSPQRSFIRSPQRSVAVSPQRTFIRSTQRSVAVSPQRSFVRSPQRSVVRSPQRSVGIQSGFRRR